MLLLLKHKNCLAHNAMHHHSKGYLFNMGSLQKYGWNNLYPAEPTVRAIYLPPRLSSLG